MKSIVSLILLFIGFVTYSQEIVKEYCDKNGTPTDEKNSYYYSIQNKKLINPDTIKTFYSATHVLRSIIVVNEHGIREGLVKYFYENGLLENQGIFKKGQPVGDISSWYSNGQLRSIEYFSEEPDFQKSRMINYWDSLGNQIVKDGTGFCECTFYPSDILEKGRLKNGIRDSLWTGFKMGKLYYEENYIHGKLEKGISYNKVSPIIKRVNPLNIPLSKSRLRHPMEWPLFMSMYKKV